MKRLPPYLFLLVLVAMFLTSCRSTKVLSDGEYMLIKNNVVVNDAKNPDFDNLSSYTRPVTNKKFMNLINLKTMSYAGGQPRTDRKGVVHDTKFRRWMRNKIGEPPVLLDSTEIDNSISQLDIVMNQLGYFDNEISYNVTHKRSNYKKVRVNYNITANEPYYISDIDYNIDIPQYRRIIVLNQKGTLLAPGMQYNENIINDELTRIINLIRNEGYFYVEKSNIRCVVSYDEPIDSTAEDPRTVSLEILMKTPDDANTSRYLYKYYFNDVYIHTNYNAAAGPEQKYDTILYQPKFKFDSTRYYFITPHQEDGYVIKDFSYPVIASVIHSRTGICYSQNIKMQSSRALNLLDNFIYTSIAYREREDMLDTINKIGHIDSYYMLTRQKVHSIGGQIDLRNDKSAISFTYTNRNLFKGAEHLTLNMSGGYFYYSLSNLFRNDRASSYPEFNISLALDFPKLFLFKNYQRRDGIKYNTSVDFGVNYSGLFRRLMYFSTLTYNWSPTYYSNHSFSPINLTTINNNDRRYLNTLSLDAYPESYLNRFGKFMLLSMKYSYSYLVPFSFSKRKHNMRFSFSAESTGLLLKGLNALFTPDHRWVISRNSLDSTGYNYSTIEWLEFNWNYTYKINNNNAWAMRFNVGAIIPLDKESYVPYERGFFMGTSNSMRGWGYRGLGPGSYNRGRDSLYTGDIKIELNLEYRGTLYHSFKYGIFTDIGNIWLARKNDDMPNAEFNIKRFYKELAVDVGVGLRLDFDFFVIRVDYAVPIYDPTRSLYGGGFINKEWFNGPRKLRFGNGLKVAIGYAF
ncbi:MAG: outer membrane protein assembly factor [Bacteroidales bacterium]|nr:outer membrane protein assembly factor [Bacteroidales bacterium]